MKNQKKTLKFKTNINCSGCVLKVTDVLENANGICRWEVDTTSKDKILEVDSCGITEKEVENLVMKAGFNIEVLNNLNEAPSCH